MLQKNFLGKMSGWVSEQTSRDKAVFEKATAVFGLREFLGNTEEPEEIIGLFSEWLVFDYKQKIFGDNTGIEYFVKNNPLNLSASEIEAYKGLLLFEAGLFEIKEVETGRGVIVESIVNGDKNFVYDINSSLSLKSGDTVWTRIAPVSGLCHMVGSTLFVVPIKIMGGMKEAMLEWKKNFFDALEIAYWMTKSTKGKNKVSNKVLKYDEVEQSFMKVLQDCHMENLFSIETFREWATNEKKYKSGFAIKALDGLIPEDAGEQEISILIQIAGDFMNNLPRKSLKGRTPNEAFFERSSDDGEERIFETDILSKEKYLKNLEKASKYMADGDFKASYKSFEQTIKDLLKDKTPFFATFRIYTNAAVCCFHIGEGYEALGEELLNASLHLNPLYDFAVRCKKKYVDSYYDGLLKGVSAKDKKKIMSFRKEAKAIGKRKYQHGAFFKYEKFLKEIGVSLKYKTHTTPTNYFFNQNGSGKAEKIKRNSPCYCGSGKKFKKCCGA